MHELLVIQSEDFSLWFRKLREASTRARIVARIRRLSLGNAGDVKYVGGGVSEMRIDCGPGYRIYFAYRESQIVILLMGGDKSTQQEDIRRSIRLLEEL